MCKEYNGWANYPTWCVALWLDDDRGLYDYACSLAREEFEYERKRDDAFKEFVEYHIEPKTDSFAGMKHDLLGWVLSSVDWREISEAYKEQVAEC